MLKELLFRDQRYRLAAVEVTAQLTTAATHLRELFADPTQLGRRASAVAEIERQIDRVTQDVRVRLDTALVTPIDPEDIHDLAWELDRVAHLIGDIAQRAVTYHIVEVREPAVGLATMLVRACERLEEAVTHVRETTYALESREAIKLLEEETDAMYTQAVGGLFVGRPDALEVLKWKDLYDLLEEAVDGCDHAAAAVAHVAIGQI